MSHVLGSFFRGIPCTDGTLTCSVDGFSVLDRKDVTLAYCKDGCVTVFTSPSILNDFRNRAAVNRMLAYARTKYNWKVSYIFHNVRPFNNYLSSVKDDNSESSCFRMDGISSIKFGLQTGDIYIFN